ncbi:MAG: twin-arginine translocase subunit TatB [Nitrosomonadales bacterium]|nr:twin-arginine translocase subunit TatB [Nitrosomonadales bacterium]
MFDIAFSELVVIMLVALVVIGPERLPKVARTMGNLWGRMQRYVNSVKNDIADELAIEEVKKLRGDISKKVTVIEQATQEARLTIEQEILGAQTGRSPDAPDEQKPSVSQSSNTSGKPV